MADYKLAAGAMGQMDDEYAEPRQTGGGGAGDEAGAPSGYGVYSFCMCPGGQIVATATQEDELCINGMSFSRRQSKWANSALVPPPVRCMPCATWPRGFALPPAANPGVQGVPSDKHLQPPQAVLGSRGVCRMPPHRILTLIDGWVDGVGSPRA